MFKMNRAQLSNGIIQIAVDATTDKINLPASIPKQTLVLKSARVEVTDAATALTIGHLSVEIPFLVSSIINDNSHGRIRIPLQNNAVTVWTPDIPLDMREDLTAPFSVVCYNKSSTLATGLVLLDLTFSYGLAKN